MCSNLSAHYNLRVKALILGKTALREHSRNMYKTELKQKDKSVQTAEASLLYTKKDASFANIVEHLDADSSFIPFLYIFFCSAHWAMLRALNFLKYYSSITA